MTIDDLQAAGLYDPTAPDAEERRVLLELAVTAGADLEEIRLAIAEGWLHAVPIQRAILGSSPRMSVAEAGGRAGIDEVAAGRLWSALGLEARACTEDDVAVFQAYAFAADLWGEAEELHLARVMASSLSRLADAEVTLTRAALEAPLRASGGDNTAVSRAMRDHGRDVLPGLHAAVTRVHSHHLYLAGRRYSLWGIAPSEASTSEVVVGFADLVGFTSLGNELDARQLDALLRTFEARAHDAATGRTTRLVKLIGDEAMFVAGSAIEALAIATELLEDDDLPPMRVGIASGPVVIRGGDVFGPPVNLAARLVAIAEPGEVLLDAVTAAACADDVPVDATGVRDLPGFPEPVEVFAISRSAG